MLQQANRLRKKRDIEITFERGRFVPGRLLHAKYWKVDPAAYPKRGYTGEELKIAVIVSKKVDKRAVYRNRIKRQVREVLRLLLKDKKIKSGYFITVMATPSVLGKTYQEIEKEVIFLLKRGKLLKEKG